MQEIHDFAVFARFLSAAVQLADKKQKLLIFSSEGKMASLSLGAETWLVEIKNSLGYKPRLLTVG
ncbi:hypothetical protein [Paenibacillus glycanilyticus]|uniref:hypothetical protein n=1 Tax=Paenibacillus glycanilyticus TaxID=126569 RepID=UPI001910897E|nr:hypothetical protein [Paenibacillus glycanilyticus]